MLFARKDKKNQKLAAMHSLKTAVFGGSEFSEDVDIYAFMLESGSLGRVVKALK